MYVHSLLLLSCNRSQPRKFSFSFKDTTTTEIYTLSLHDALPISKGSADVLDHATSEKAIGTKLDALEGLENPNSRVAELHESAKAPSPARMRPLKADWTRFFPRHLRRVRRVVGDVANLRPVQGDLEMRALEGDLDMVPIFLLAEIRELLVARVEPEDVSSDGFGMHTVDDDANELSRLATPEVHLIAGPQIHAAVVGACGTRAVRGCRLLGKHEVDLQLEVFESRQRNETLTFLTRSCPSANDDAVLHFPAGLGGAQGRT